MKSTDLMIGDWLYSIIDRYDYIEKKPCRITGIRVDGNPLIQCNDTDVWYMVETYEPIPLTPEILEKNGWKLCHNEGFLFCLDEERKLYIDVLDGEIANYFRNIAGDYEWHLIAYCKYVHQLQHALKLFGIEKEIVL